MGGEGGSGAGAGSDADAPLWPGCAALCAAPLVAAGYVRAAATGCAGAAAMAVTAVRSGELGASTPK